MTDDEGPNTSDSTKGGRVRRKIRKACSDQSSLFLQRTRMQHTFPIVDLYLPFQDDIQCFPYRSFLVEF